ncbi:hypothetical protein GIW81_13365 [Hyphomicrobium sp. xq]|uniref:Uncharacterized protein n=1 Tax=Hyphomicrobium album TaxID=2665159 RepID=A0A6I3KNI9_9HYPH|nr:hypothetical protein [Hyphomicrobium album]MTD95322.1 hypothetical protein [Hyphomicrobium album]
MVQTSMQFTPVQVLQAARRAEAEGKMDYALQFYRHLVEQHGTTAEAQEAREGLFRIAEWRWGEARVARSRESGGQAAQPAAQAPPSPSPGGQRVYNVGNQSAASGYADPQQVPMPRVARPAESDLPAFQPRFRLSKVVAHALSAIGWVMLLGGVFAAVAGGGGFVGELSAVAFFGLPLGVLTGAPALVLGLVFIVAGQIAAAVFDTTNATLELVAIERGRSSF